MVERAYTPLHSKQNCIKTITLKPKQLNKPSRNWRNLFAFPILKAVLRLALGPFINFQYLRDSYYYKTNYMHCTNLRYHATVINISCGSIWSSIVALIYIPLGLMLILSVCWYTCFQTHETCCRIDLLFGHMRFSRLRGHHLLIIYSEDLNSDL